MLDQTCQILVQTETTPTRFVPGKEVDTVIFDNVQCSFDTLMDARVGMQKSAAVGEIRGGGLLFIDGDYGYGVDRQFNEKNLIRLNGWEYNIDFVHDIHTATGLDHYEVELLRRVTGGVPNA